MANGSSWRRLRRIFRQDPAAEVDDELEFHLERRVRDYVARGMEPGQARKRAIERLGDLERVRSECRASLLMERRAHERRIRLNVSWLDVKLGLRMLVKYPGLSLVAVVGMAVAIAIGAGSFGIIYALMDPTLPLDEGDRVVSIQNNRADDPGNPDRHALHDFVLWREALRSVRDLGAFQGDRRNLIAADGSTELVRVAAMTASGFEVARVAPALGRPLIGDDERVGAAPVVVIAYEEWQSRFDGDPDIVGRTIRLGSVVHTVVGVMPEGFRFPIAHRFWVPLRLRPSEHERGGGPRIYIFGRLADGVTLRQAQAELTAIGRGTAAAFPDTHEHLRPRILPYTRPFILDMDSPAIAWRFHLFQLAVSTLLVVASLNVAILVYARTATRTGEIAVRTALGASRRRVVTQLFVEALTLSVIATALGLTIAHVALVFVEASIRAGYGAELAFWLEFGLSSGMVVYGAGLAVLAGLIIGVVPALEATGRRVQTGLQQLSSRGSQIQLGRTWTVLIVVQVAIAVAVLPGAVHSAAERIRSGTRDAGYPAGEFLRAELSMQWEEPPPAADAEAYDREFEARFAARTTELIRRIEAEPGVSGVTYASYFPGPDEPTAWIEVESVGTSRVDPRRAATATATERARAASDHAVRAGSVRHPVRINHVDIGFFDVFDVPTVAGRGFVEGDTREGSTAVIVNRAFVEQIAGGGNVVGRRVRRSDSNDDATPSDVEENPWSEIVGVVPDFPNARGFDVADPKLYYPATPGQARLIVRFTGAPAAGFAARLRDITAAVDPALQLQRLQSAEAAHRNAQRLERFMALAIGIATASVLLLSAAGIYAMMSFTVARRRREIGIRVALGADARRVLTGVFARATAQLGIGIAAGLILAAALDRATGGEITRSSRAVILLPGVAALILAVGLAAAFGPARRGLAVQPTEALREE